MCKRIIKHFETENKMSLFNIIKPIYEEKP